jgi:hypothetical protein
MDDRFLQDQRRDPDPAFARGLRARLRRIEDEEPPHRAPAPLPLLAAAAALVAVAALIAFPGLRLRAQAMLDLFRVRDFAVVQVDEARAEQLRARHVDPGKLLIGDTRQVLEGGPAQVFTSLDAAASAAGFTPEHPELLPRGLVADTVFVHHGGRASAQVDTRALRELMDTFDVRDLQLPAGLDGQSVEIEMPTIMAQSFRGSGRLRAALMQCASPEVSLPKGVDLARLGEIGLRLVGLGRDEAHRLAGTIDWRSTLVVPVLASATSFRQVEVRGDRGLYVETSRTDTPEGSREGPGAAVLWTRAGRVYVLGGNLDRVSMLQMAESVR